MKQFFPWAKDHALTLFLVAVVLALAANQLKMGRSYSIAPMATDMVAEKMAIGGGVAADMATRSFMPSPMYEVPPSFSQNRLVLTETSLSLLVKDVAVAIQSIRQKSQELGGFLVDSSLNAPEGADTGSITVRVPADKQEDALTAFRGFSVRVTNESVIGQDVTDQFEDVAAQLAVLEKTKVKFEAILDDAKTVDESLRVQQQLISLQQQIDALKGRQQYYERSAQMVRITAYLSTDETALPYTPDEAWRPQAIFRMAVRSLIGVLQGAGTTGIWIVVFAPLWIPVALLLLWLAKRMR